MGESQKENDLFFTCSLIEYIARKTKNKKKMIIEKLGEERIKKIYELAEVYHSENIDKVSDEFIEEADLKIGDYDKISECKYRVPTFWEIGKIYKRLIIRVNNNPDDYIQTLQIILESWIIEAIDNYNSSMYYENPEYIYQCYLEGRVL